MGARIAKPTKVISALRAPNRAVSVRQMPGINARSSTVATALSIPMATNNAILAMTMARAKVAQKLVRSNRAMRVRLYRKTENKRASATRFVAMEFARPMKNAMPARITAKARGARRHAASKTTPFALRTKSERLRNAKLASVAMAKLAKAKYATMATRWVATAVAPIAKPSRLISNATRQMKSAHSLSVVTGNSTITTRVLSAKNAISVLEMARARDVRISAA